jgi:predicted GNAT superfamily acetyltransferase
MSYESPITAIYDQIATQINQDFEDRIMAEVKMKVDVDVDKDELIKALNYDRGQYEKGMEDAKRVLKPMCRNLGKCMSHPDISREYYDYCYLYREDCKFQCFGGRE